MEDANLSDTQKRTQLLYLIRSVDEPLLYDFLSDELTSSQFWLFTSDRIDYFDRFVQEFQNATEAVKVIYLSTAVPLNATDLQLISENFSTSFGYKVMVEHEHNPALIGGVQARIENLIVDHSLRTKFQHFQRHWLKSLESIESAIGRNEPDNLI